MPDSTHTAQFTSLWRLMAAGLFVVLVLHVFVHCSYHDFLGRSGNYVYKRQPLLTSSDGYHHLAQAAVLAGGTHGDIRTADPQSLLVEMTACVSRITGFPLRTVAYYLSPVLATSVLAVLVGFGLLIGRPEAGLVAALVQAASPYWFMRTRLGSFDTDPLIPFFLLAGLLCVAGFVNARGVRRRAVWLAGCMAACWLSALWWPQVWWLTAAACLGGYALTVGFGQHTAERAAKAAILAFMLALVAIVALDAHHHVFPEFMARTLSAARDHVVLLLSGAGQSGFSKVNVGELGHVSSFTTMKLIGGSYLGFVASLGGLVLFVVRLPRFAAPLLPLMALGALLPIAVRLAVFQQPVSSIGVGYLCSLVMRHSWLDGLDRGRWFRPVLTVAMAGAIVVPALLVTLRMHPSPAFNATQAELAERIGQVTEPGTVIWSTWSKGYFLEYFSGRRAFANGGTLDPYHLYVSERVFSMDGSVAAANWIRFFGRRGVNGLRNVMTNAKVDMSGAVDLLERMFADQAGARSLGEAAGLRPWKKWRKIIFPGHRPIVVYLDHLMINTAPSWFLRGTWDFRAGKGLEGQVTSCEVGDMTMDETARRIAASDTGRAPGRLLEVGPKGLRETITGPGRWGLLHFAGQDVHTLLGPEFMDSLFMRLFVLSPSNTPRFEPVFHEPLHAGLWLVR